MKYILPMFIAFTAATVMAADKPWPMPIELNASATPIKNLSGNTSGTGLGFASSLLEDSAKDNLQDWLFVRDREGTAKVFREAGVTLVRYSNGNSRWRVGMTWAEATDDVREEMKKHYRSTPLVDPKSYFSFWKENGIKVIVCLISTQAWEDPVTAKGSKSLDLVKNDIADFTKWIVDNGYTDVVAGFEMDNEPFFGNDPEGYGERWRALIPIIRAALPEAKLGLPIAEYKASDPDIDVVRARMTNPEWMNGEKGVSKINQWSGRAIVALGDCLKDVSHVIYHFYGANAAHGCSPSGFSRIRNFAKVFPEIADKRVWITEFRERSDEDLRCQQTFFSSLWKGHYLLEVICQPEIDCALLHHLGSLGGAISTAVAGHWMMVLQPGGAEFPDPDYAGRPRIEVGPCGPVFQLYNDALHSHPVILAHGTANDGLEATYWHGSLYYDSMSAYIKALADGKNSLPHVKGKTVEWVAALSEKKDSLAILMVNTKDEPVTMPISIAGARFNGAPEVRSVSCPSERILWHLIPGEKAVWKTCNRTGAKVTGSKFTLNIEPNSVQTVVISLTSAK